MTDPALIDDFRDSEQASNGQQWRFFSDQVMGGISQGTVTHPIREGRPALALSGTVSLENNGGFIQVALDLAPPGQNFDASAFGGFHLSVIGDGGLYALNVRTSDLRYPWQSYRCAFKAPLTWTDLRLPFGDFVAHRTDRPLESRRLRRVGLIAIGEARRVSVALSRLAFLAPSTLPR